MQQTRNIHNDYSYYSSKDKLTNSEKDRILQELYYEFNISNSCLDYSNNSLDLDNYSESEKVNTEVCQDFDISYLFNDDSKDYSIYYNYNSSTLKNLRYKKKKDKRIISLHNNDIINGILQFPKLNQVFPLKLKTIGILCSFSILIGGFFVFSNINNRQADAVNMIMYQNVESKISRFQHELNTDKYSFFRPDELIYYTTKEGDTVKKIAQKFHLSEKSIKVNNPILSKMKILKKGTKLVIVPTDGILHPIRKGETIFEISRRYNVSPTKIITSNKISNAEFIREDDKIVIPGIFDLKFRKPRLTTTRLANISKKVKSGKVNPFRVVYTYRKESRERIVKRYFGGSHFIWPVNGYLSSGYGWRWGGFHPGIDIAAPYGASIRAANSGTVLNVGWMGGYGYAVDINHGNGVVTRYAHCSSIFVSIGQQVFIGQPIAAIGSTGRSTGPHVHFEVIINGSNRNPINYLR